MPSQGLFSSARRLARRAQLITARWRARRLIALVGSRSGDESRYIERPRSAAVLQFFNKRENIPMLLAGMRAGGFDELIVLEDGSSDGSTEIWTSHLDQKNDFLIRSNDLFEVRSYQRALDFTRAEFVALLQDDDELPTDSSWMDEAIAWFRSDPLLAIIGGRDGLDVLPLNSPLQDATFVDGQMRYTSYRVHADRRYAMVVNRAPMILRRSMIQELGGIDQVFAPFQCDDVDLCLRAWQRGLRVGLYDPSFPRRNVGEGGMRLFNSERTARQAAKNWPLIYARHLPLIEGDLRGRIQEINSLGSR